MSASGPSATSAEEAEVRRVVDGYVAAVLAKDVAAFAAWYDPAVRVFDTWGVWSYDGIDAWRKMAEGWFASLGADRVAVTMDELRIDVAGDVALVTAFATYRSEIDAPKAMSNRLTWVLRLRDGRWTIVHEHTSAPADFDSARLILRR